MFCHIIISIISWCNFDIRHCKRLIAPHILSISLCIWLTLDLDTTIPVIFRDFRIAFHNVTISIHATVYLIIQFTASGFRFQNTAAYRIILWSSRTGFIIVIDHIEHGGIIATIRRTMHPIKYYIINEVEYSIPAYRRIATRVAGPKVTHKCTVLTSQRTAECMVIGIQRFRRNCILNSYIDCRKLQILAFILTFTRIVHMTVERYIFVQSPCTWTVVYHDITNRITTERVVTMPYFCFSTTESHMTYNYVVCIHPKWFSGNADTITRCCLSGNSNVRSTNDNRRIQFDNTGNIKHNDTSTTSLTRLTERTRTTVIQICNRNYLTTTATKTIHSASFSTRKRRYFSLWQVIRTTGPWNIRTSLFGFFQYYW